MNEKMRDHKGKIISDLVSQRLDSRRLESRRLNTRSKNREKPILRRNSQKWTKHFMERRKRSPIRGGKIAKNDFYKLKFLRYWRDGIQIG